MNKFIDLSGVRFGILSAIKINGRSGVNKRLTWLCKCDCGNITTVIGENLKYGHTKSCGCIRIESTVISKTTHGATRSGIRSAEYNSWRALSDRCYNTKNKGYKHYGARGIKVCKRWSRFENFLSDMGEKPTAKHSIDRKNNDGNYTPSNCRWATSKQQTRNYRRNRFLVMGGVKQTITDWAEKYGISSRTISHRLNIGWSVKKSITTTI